MVNNQVKNIWISQNQRLLLDRFAEFLNPITVSCLDTATEFFTIKAIDPLFCIQPKLGMPARNHLPMFVLCIPVTAILIFHEFDRGI